eukprot:3314987-Pyramimonas_sp.AAC.1
MDKETFDQESRVWKPVEGQLWIGHGYHRRLHLIRNPPGSEAPGARSCTSAPTVQCLPQSSAPSLLAC